MLLEQASRLITTDHGGTVGRERLEQALRLGKDHVVLFGQPIDTRPYLERAGQRTVGIALTALQESLRNETQGVDVVLLGNWRPSSSRSNRVVGQSGCGCWRHWG